MSKDELTIRISKSGVRLENPVFEEQLGWDEVGEIEALTTWDDLEIADSEGLPYRASGTEMVIGDSTAEVGQESKSPDSEQTSLSSHSIWAEIEEHTGAKYDPEDDTVEFPEGKSSSSVYRDLLNYLFDNDLLSRDDLPWGSSSSEKHYLLNTEPKNKKGGKMPGAIEIVDGVFFYSKPPKENMERYLKEFVKDTVIEE